MSLLARSHDWDKYKSSHEEFFRDKAGSFSYGSFCDLRHVLVKYCKASDKVLVMGRESYKLSEELYDTGFHNIVNIGSSQAVPGQASPGNKRPSLQCVTTDTTKVDITLPPPPRV